MANLGATFDATAIEPIQSLEVLPPGNYTAQIVNSDIRLTKDGEGHYLFLEIDVLEGPCQGRKLFDRLNLKNAKSQTVEIAKRTLSAICHATGCMQLKDSKELHMIPFLAIVTVQPPKNGYGETNKIRYQQLQPATSAPPPTTTPTPRSAPAAGGFTTAPWKRST
jgi:hypothetical protein